MNYSKEQKLKISFIQLGKKYNLPKEIIIYLYNYLRKLNNCETDKIINYHKSNIFNSSILKELYCPLNRGLEWCIKQTADCNREYLLMELRIIGLDGYLYRKSGENIYKASMKDKIKYLNLGYEDEVIDDYKNFLTWRGTQHESAWILLIDDYGDSSFL